MTMLTILLFVFITALIISIVFNYYQKREIKKTLRLLDMKTQNVMLAIRAGNIAVWGYDVKRNILYDIEGEVFPGGVATVEEAMAEVHPDDREEFANVFQSVVGGVMPSETVCIRFKNMYTGEWEYIEKEFAVIKSRTGEVETVIGTHKDVTKRVIEKENTDELLEKYQHLYTENQTILNSLPIGVTIYNKEAELSFVNQSLCELFGIIAPQKLLEEKLCLWNHPLLCDELNIKFRNGEKTIFHYKTNCHTPPNAYVNISDKPIYISCLFNTVRNERGEIESYIFMHRDITRQKMQGEELEVSRNDVLASNQLLREILSRIPSLLFIKDPNNDYKYVISNKIFCDVFGKTENDIFGKTDYDFLGKEQADSFRKTDEYAMSREEPFVFEEETCHGGNHQCWKTVKSSFKGVNNRRLLIGMSVDITEIRKTNNELQQAKIKAEESDKLKSAFLANMSHEIRTPLNAIVGFSELMQSCDDKQEKEEYMRIIAANNELLLRLINDILDLSKLESGIVQLHNTRFDLVQYFDELSVSVQKRITNPKIEFIPVNPYKSCIIETDRTKMAQVWHNFMTNAIKYTVSGYIKMGYEYVNDGILIYVEDTGIGIPDSKKDKLFHRFEKLDSFAQGTGLGLSICKAITELGGGNVGFESTEGKGSRFWSWRPIEAQIIP